MPSSSDRPAVRLLPPRRRAAALLLSAVLGTGAVLVGAGPASAHDRLTSTNPADGATVETAPEAVVLTMSSAPLGLGTQVQVTGPDGAVVSSGDPQIVDEDVTEALTGPRPAGTYQVQWRITSSDGHPVSGSFSFTATSAAGTTSPSASPTASPSTPATPSAPATSTAAGTPAASAGSEGAGGSALIGIAAAVVVVLGGVGGIIGYRRRQR